MWERGERIKSLGKLEEFVFDHDHSNYCFIVRRGELDSDVETILVSGVGSRGFGRKEKIW